MDKVRLALILITIAIVVGPILGFLLAYRNNLMELIVPSEIEQIMATLDGSPENGTQPENIPENTTHPDTSPDNITYPDQIGPVDIQYDPATLTVTVTFQLKNPSPFDVTLNSISGTVQCDDHSYPLGTASLKNPVQLIADEPATVTVLVALTQQGIDHTQTAHQGQTSMKISLAGATINASGMTIEMTEPLALGEVPLT